MLNSLSKQFPDENDGTLDCGSVAQSCAFNRFGTLLAVGCRDGSIVLWDLLTRGITRTFTGHSYSVTTLGWSRSGQFLASGALDGTLYVWDVAVGERCHAFHFSAQLVKVHFHPRCSSQALVCVSKQHPVVVDMATNKSQPVPDAGENITAAYSRRGDHILTGNSRGMVTVFQTDTLEELVSVRVPTSLALTQIKSIEFCGKRGLFLVSSADRVIRLFDGDTLPGGSSPQKEPVCLQRMQDLVNRTMWKSCHFSGDGSYVVAACSREHILHIYETSTGSLVKILKGSTGEDLSDVAWHPLRPMVISVCSGTVNVWVHNPVENWSAFAPNFSELEENEEYDERESEFDEEDEDRSEKGDDGELAGEDLEVDVVAVDTVAPYMSSDEEDSSDVLLGLPVRPDIDEEEQKEWQQAHDPAASNLKRKLSEEAAGDEERPAKRLKVVEITARGVSATERAISATPSPTKSSSSGPATIAPVTVASASSLHATGLTAASEREMLGSLASQLPALAVEPLPAAVDEDLSSIFADLLQGNGSVSGYPLLPTTSHVSGSPSLNLGDLVP